MRFLLGLFFFSILLTAGSSLQCVTCVALNGYCSDVKEECFPELNVCMSLLLKLEEKKLFTMKSCAPKIACKQFEELIGKDFPFQVPGIGTGAVIKEATCSSKAPPSFSSFFPAFLGLLLMKLLF